MKSSVAIISDAFVRRQGPHVEDTLPCLFNNNCSRTVICFLQFSIESTLEQGTVLLITSTKLAFAKFMVKGAGGLRSLTRHAALKQGERSLPNYSLMPIPDPIGLGSELGKSQEVGVSDELPTVMCKVDNQKQLPGTAMSSE